MCSFHDLYICVCVFACTINMSITDLAVASFVISVNCNANKRVLLNTFFILETNDYNCKSIKKISWKLFAKMLDEDKPSIHIHRSINFKLSRRVRRKSNRCDPITCQGLT